MFIHSHLMSSGLVLAITLIVAITIAVIILTSIIHYFPCFNQEVSRLSPNCCKTHCYNHIHIYLTILMSKYVFARPYHMAFNFITELPNNLFLSGEHDEN